MRLTAATIRSISLPDGVRERTFFDDDVPGFGLRVRSGGSKRWVVQYKFGTKHRRLVLGPVAALDPGRARETAKDLLAAVRLGRDPAGEKIEAQGRAAETLGALLQRYLAHQKSRLKPRSYREVQRHLLTHAKPLHSRNVAAIDRRLIAARLAELAETSGQVAANRVRASLSAAFGWLAREGLVEANPVANTNKALEGGARARVLTAGELAHIWAALGDDHYGSIIKLLVFTAARRDEIGNLAWDEIDFGNAVICLPAERVKNNRPHTIPLMPATLAILQAQPRRTLADGTARALVFGTRRSGFSDWSKRKLELDQKIEANRKAAGLSDPMPAWRHHDLRRSAATYMAELDVSPHIIESVLGHTGGHKAGVAGTYNRAGYEAQKRHALAVWETHVLAILEGRVHGDRVVPLRAMRVE